MAIDPEAADTPDAIRPVPSQPPGGFGGDGTTALRPNDDGPDLLDTIIADRYKIRQEIGEGGWGLSTSPSSSARSAARWR
jgi:hypothetical protein